MNKLNIISMKTTREQINQYHYDAFINVIKNSNDKCKYIDNWKQIANDFFICGLNAKQMSEKYNLSTERIKKIISIMNTYTFFSAPYTCFKANDDVVVNDVSQYMIRDEKGNLIGFEPCDFIERTIEIDEDTQDMTEYYYIHLIECFNNDVYTMFKYNSKSGWDDKNMTESQILTDIKNIILDFYEQHDKKGQ